MVFKRFIEVGRVIVINYGALKNKLAVVVDVLTTTKLLIDGPHVRRQELSINRVTLTDLKIDIPRSAPHNAVIKAYNEKKVDEEFKKTSFAKTLERREKRHNLTDFDRFKVMRLRQKRRVLKNKALPKKKAAKKEAKAPKDSKKDVVKSAKAEKPKEQPADKPKETKKGTKKEKKEKK